MFSVREEFAYQLDFFEMLMDTGPASKGPEASGADESCSEHVLESL